MEQEIVYATEHLEAYLKRSEGFGIDVLALAIRKVYRILEPYEEKVRKTHAPVFDVNDVISPT